MNINIIFSLSSTRFSGFFMRANSQSAQQRRLLSFPIFLSLSLIFACCSIGSLQAQTSTKQAWEKFFQNDRNNSRKMFSQLAEKPATADEANIGLALLSELDRPYPEAFTFINKLYKSSTNPQPYLFALWGSPSINYNSGRKTPEQLEFLTSLANRTDYDGTLPAMASSLIGKHYETIKDYVKADQQYGRLGELENWMITGEYENISTSGFDKVYDVLDKPQADAMFKGKNNRQFGWRKVPYLRHDKWFDFSYYNSYHNALQFAQTFVNSPDSRSVQLRVGVSGSVKVWVNDQLVLSEAEERNNDLDSYISTVKLNAGYNRVLVQIGESYANRSNFMARITDEQGQPISALTTSAAPQKYTKASAVATARLQPFAFRYFEDKLKKQPNNYLDRLMLSKLYLRQGDIFEARSLMEKLKQEFPQSTYLNGMFIELFSRANNRTGIETLQESILSNDPESAAGLELAYSRYMEQQDFTNAEATAKKLEAIYGEDEPIYLKKVTLASKRKNQQEVIDLIEKAYARYPDYGTIAGMKYSIEKDVRKNPSAIDVLQKYISNNDDYSSAKYVAQLYLDKGDRDAGLNIYQTEIKNDPIGLGIYADLGDQFYKLQYYDKAEKTYLQELDIDPNNSRAYAALGQVYNMMKQKEKSTNAYKKSLLINPNDYDVIESLRRLQDKKPVFDYFVQPDVKALIAAAPGLKEYPDDHVLTLDNEIQKVVYENGGSEEKHLFVAKILTQKGLESMKEYKIPYNSDQNLNVEVAEVIKGSGTKVPAERNRNEVIFTNLEVGDVINLRYKIENYFVGTLASHFWDSFYFADGFPYVTAKYSLLIHKDKVFKYAFSQQPVPLVKTKKDEFDLYVWQQSNQKALVYEDKMPPMDDVTNKLYISSIPDWQYMSNWYNDIAAAKARSSYEVKSVVESLFAGKTGLDELSKVKLIYKYITSNISYSSVSFRQSGIIPQNPATVINTRIGDCKDVATLFVTMCKEAGIKAELALASTRDNGLNTLLLPSMEFNHCIAKAIVNGQDYWVELTSNSLPFNTFDNSFIHSNILEINKSANKLTNFNPAIRSLNTMNYQTVVTLKDADMQIKENNQNTGSAASYLRDVFNDLSATDQIKKMKEQLSRAYPENEVDQLTFGNLNTASASNDTVTTSTAYQLLNVMKPVAGLDIFSIPWSNKNAAADLQILAGRKSGIDLTQLFGTDSYNQELVLNLPKDKNLVQAYPAIHISNEFVEFNIESALKDQKLIFKRNFHLKNDFVPQDKVLAFKNIYKQMVDADAQQLALK
ncbi:MAG: DUF3857 domain-containing protein [Pedobacter sp.]|nr:MAG: DUF3857 domain-containing protein [Pedobacter sp.]